MKSSSVDRCKLTDEKGTDSFEVCSSHALAERQSLKANWSLSHDVWIPSLDKMYGSLRSTKGSTRLSCTWTMAKSCFLKVFVQKLSAMYVVSNESKNSCVQKPANDNCLELAISRFDRLEGERYRDFFAN